MEVYRSFTLVLNEPGFYRWCPLTLMQTTTLMEVIPKSVSTCLQLILYNKKKEREPTFDNTTNTYLSFFQCPQRRKGGEVI